MGLYDREYSRYGEPQSGYQLAAPQSATMQLLAVTVGVYLVQLVFKDVTDFLVLPYDWYRRPWEAYRLLSYGFAHAPNAIEHIICNMLILGFFGRPVEDRYGRKAFLAFYLVSIVAGGLFWSLVQSLYGERSVMLGASAAVTGVFLLFALNYPRAEVRLFFMLPVPAWVAALLGVAVDVNGAITRSGSVAFTAHLAGATCAWLFYRYGSLAGQGLGRWTGSLRRGPRTRLKVHSPDEEDEPDDLSLQVDRILAKIQERGQDSLTRSERKVLEKASREYQQKRK